MKLFIVMYTCIWLSYFYEASYRYVYMYMVKIYIRFSKLQQIFRPRIILLIQVHPKKCLVEK